MCYWHPVGRVQRCSQTSSDARAPPTAKNDPASSGSSAALRPWSRHGLQPVLSCPIPTWLGVRQPVPCEGVCGSVLECSQIHPHTEAQQGTGIGPGVFLLEGPLASCKRLMTKGSYLEELRSVGGYRSARWSPGIGFPRGPS